VQEAPDSALLLAEERPSERQNAAPLAVEDEPWKKKGGKPKSWL
jgi:hypothetical protein